MATLLQPRRGTAALWTSVNPTLAVGEWGFETDTGKWKAGDGSTAWTSLAYSGRRLSADAMSFLASADFAAMRTALGISSFGASLIDDADAAAARATLGLGTAATSASTAFAAAARPTGAHYHVPLAAGQYLNQQVNAAAPTTAAMAANRLELVPFVPARDLTIDRLAFEVTTAQAGNSARVGVWADSSGVPGALLVGGGTSHSVASLGVLTETVSLSMTAGTLYWLGLHSEGATAQFRACLTAGAPIFGTAAGGSVAGYTSWRGTPTYSSGLPNPPVSMTRTGGAIAPLIYLRVA